jgi:hypothetical protein
MAQDQLDLVVRSEQEAYEFLDRYLRHELPTGTYNLRFEGWPKVVIHLEGPRYHATITPTVMRGLVALQKEIYRSYSIAKFNRPNTQQLTRQERKDLEFEVKVSNGSSTYEIDFQAIAIKLLELSVGRMDSHDLTAVVLSFAALFFGSSMLKTFLDDRRQKRETELKSEDQRKLIEHLKFSTEEETKRMGIMSELVRGNPRIGNLQTYAEDARLALLKSVTSADTAEIQGIEIDGDAAEVLAQNARAKSKEVRLDGAYRIQVVDSGNPDDFRLKIVNIDSKDQFTATVQDESLTADARRILQEAEWSKRPVLLKINAREIRETIRDAVIIGVDIFK